MKDREFSRTDRVGATIRRVLAQPLNELARSSGAGLVTITAVDVAPDMRRATVRLSIYGGETEQRGQLDHIIAAAAELQAVLGRELRTRRTPVLSFRLDDGIARGDRISQLLNRETDVPVDR